MFLAPLADAAPVVSHIRTYYRPQSVYVGSETFSGGATSAGSVERIGPSPIMRLSLDRWSDIETSPGVYDWGQSSVGMVADAHRSGAEAMAPVLIAGAIPAFYSSNLADATTRSAAQAFATAYAARGVSLGGPFMTIVDPRVQETVFDALPADPDDWASLFTLTASAIRTVDPGMKVLPAVVGDGHSSYLPGAWLTTAMAGADVLGIEETSQLVSTVLSDLDWFVAGPAAGKKIWIVGSAFSTFAGTDPRAHGTETEQAAYFGNLLTNVVVGYSSKVEAVIQTSLADEGTSSLWEHHLGVTTMSMALDKPATGVFRGFVDNYPPYHPVFQVDRSAMVSQEASFPLLYLSPTDFEYLDWSGVIDMSQVTGVTVDFQVTSPDGYPGYLLRVGSSWQRIGGGLVDIKPSLGHGTAKLRFIVPTTRFEQSVTVQHLRVTPVINANIPDIFAPRIESVQVNRRISVRFSDDLDPATSLVKGNYQLRDLFGQPLSVYQVIPVGTRAVELQTGPQQPRAYRLIVSGVRDESGNLMSGATADTILFQGREFAREDQRIFQPIDVSAQQFGPGGAWDIKIQFEGDSGQGLDVDIFDVRGRLVSTLVRGAAVSRASTWTWNGNADSGSRAAAGVYFIRARSGRSTGQSRLTVSR